MDPLSNRNGVLVGLTGAIGAGKSTVAAVFEKFGIPVLRADDIAKELMRDDADIRRGVIRICGEEAYSGGMLNRAYVARTIFQSRDALEKMNALIHPRTIAAQEQRAARYFASGTRVVACEAALIYESGAERRFDYVVVVDAPLDVRVRRAADRDNVNAELILRREEAQIPAIEKVSLADFVIRNEGTLDQLEHNAQFIATLLLALPPRAAILVNDLPDHEGDGDHDAAG